MKSAFRAHAVVIVLGLSASAGVAQVIKSKPIELPRRGPTSPAPRPTATMTNAQTKLPPAVTLSSPVRVARPGKLATAQIRARVQANNLQVRTRRTKMLVFAMTIPGIGRVNGQPGGTFEPGSDYEIAGTGFGPSQGSVLLRVTSANRAISLPVSLWSDKLIYVHVPDDVSGLLDSPAELVVGPPGKAPYKSTKFSFYAAREDTDLAIPSAWFQHDGAESYNLKPKLSFDGKWFSVSRVVTDTNVKRCIEPGHDRISWGGLKPGFDVTSFYFSRMNMSNGSDYTSRGQFAFNWVGDSIAVDFGVLRYYVAKYGLVGGYGDCTSNYKINLVVTGPRGVKPL